MRRHLAATLALAVAILASTALPVDAQLSDSLGALTADNARKYLGPLPDALSGTMNSAIFTSGKVPKTGFSLSVGVKGMGVRFADGDRLFTPTYPSGFTPVPPVIQAPTVIGDKSAVTQNGQGGASIDFPGGFDLSGFAFAAPQLEIGSVMGTRAVVRWLAINVPGDGFVDRISFFGIGGQHSLSQHLPFLPVDLALGVFYQTFKINKSLLDIRTFHADITGSRSFSILQPYAAIGLDSFEMDVAYQDTSNPGSPVDVAVGFDRQSNVRLTAGVLANLAIAKLHAEVNIAATNGAAVGLSFGR